MGTADNFKAAYDQFKVELPILQSLVASDLSHNFVYDLEFSLQRDGLSIVIKEQPDNVSQLYNVDLLSCALNKYLFDEDLEELLVLAQI